MGQTTFCNMRGIVHKGSNGQSIAFPDVCKTPTPAGPYSSALPLGHVISLFTIRQPVRELPGAKSTAWIPVIRGAHGLYEYLQAVQGYLAPPIFVVFFFGVFFKRLNAKGCLWAGT